MEIIAVDPGLTIGLAYLDATNGTFEVFQTDNPEEALYQIEIWQLDRFEVDHFLVEDYISGGHLTKEAKITIKLVGLFQHWGNYFYGGSTLVAPQARLSSVSKAAETIGHKDLATMHRNGKDAIAALAHAISYARENDS